MTVFGRKIEVLFTGPGGASIKPDGENLSIGFTVERNLDAEPSTMVATIHNLSKDTQESLRDAGEGWTVTLSAGYGDNAEAIFTGHVRVVRHRREPPLLSTDIEADDGGDATGKFVTKRFGKGTSVGTVVKWLQEQSGLGAGNVAVFSQIGNTKSLPNRIESGMTIRGYVMDELSDLARSREVRISSQNNEITVLKPGEALAGVPTTKISPATGLIGYPYVDNDGILTLNHRMLPNVFPGAPVEVASDFVDGRFVVERAVYSGSLFGDDFNTEIEGVAAL